MSIVLAYPNVWQLTVYPHRVIIFSISSNNSSLFSVKIDVVLHLQNHNACIQILNDIYQEPNITLISSNYMPLDQSGNLSQHRLQVLYSATVESTNL